MRRLARVLVYLGIVAVVFGLAAYHANEVADPPYEFTGDLRFGWSIAFVGVLALTAYGLGLPELPRSARQATSSAVVTVLLAVGTISVVQLFVGDALLPRFVVFGSGLLLVPWFLACTALARGGERRAERLDRVLFVGDPHDAELLARDLAAAPERPGRVAGTLTAAGANPGAARQRPLVDLAVEVGVTVVVLDRGAQNDESIVAQAAALHEHGVRIRTLSLFYEESLGKLPVSELERVSLLFDIGELHRAQYVRLKRIFDVGFGIFGLVLLVVCVPVVALGDLIANRGPLLYRQRRVGKNGKAFTMVKFRTMRPTAAGGLPDEWTTENDPRITAFGRLLRLSHLDELPQVLNVLRGDLSIVGPRPEQPHYVAELRTKIPFYDVRHLVRPGLTGWAQVKYGYAGDERDALEKLQYDIYYLRRQGLALDLRVVARTLRTVLRLGGR